MAEGKTTRVVQMWPEDLKATVQNIVGSRKLTDWTIRAVMEKLERDGVTSEVNGKVVLPERPTYPSQPKEEPKDEKVQKAEQAVETAPEPEHEPGAYAEPEEPKAELKPARAPRYTPHDEVAIPEREDEGPPAVMEASATEATPDPGDFFAQVKQRAQAAGIPVAMASDLPRPPVSTTVDFVEPIEDDQPDEAPAQDSSRCPTCGDELVDGECWTCG